MYQILSVDFSGTRAGGPPVRWFIIMGFLTHGTRTRWLVAVQVILGGRLAR